MIIIQLTSLDDTINHTGKIKKQAWHLLSRVEAKQQGKERNTARMVNHIVSTVGFNIIGKTIVLSSTRIDKGNFMPNLKMNN